MKNHTAVFFLSKYYLKLYIYHIAAIATINILITVHNYILCFTLDITLYNFLSTY